MGKTLSKAGLLKAVAKRNGYTKRQATDVIETLLEIIKSTLESGEDVLVSGFSKFCVKHKKERRGRNPATDEDMMLVP
jgi:integration host factor subunit alpha